MRNKTLECTINDYAKYWLLADILNAPPPKGHVFSRNNMASEYQRSRIRHWKIISEPGLNPLTLFAVLS
ncbi:MAG TPA: hypothetical protein VL854_10225 [Nitrososphaeraceae archaeon]|jgi:hypothetical protein|nr:hypothetical protein [Nitrososphaeraceae archaeon]